MGGERADQRVQGRNVNTGFHVVRVLPEHLGVRRDALGLDLGESVAGPNQHPLVHEERADVLVEQGRVDGLDHDITRREALDEDRDKSLHWVSPREGLELCLA